MLLPNQHILNFFTLGLKLCLLLSSLTVWPGNWTPEVKAGLSVSNRVGFSPTHLLLVVWGRKAVAGVSWPSWSRPASARGSLPVPEHSSSQSQGSKTLQGYKEAGQVKGGPDGVVWTRHPAWSRVPDHFNKDRDDIEVTNGKWRLSHLVRVPRRERAGGAYGSWGGQPCHSY